MTLDKSGCRRVQSCAKFSQAETWMPLFCRLFESAHWCISENKMLTVVLIHFSLAVSGKPSMLHNISSSGPTIYVLRSYCTLWNDAKLVDYSWRPTHGLVGLLITLACRPALIFAVKSSVFIYNGTRPTIIKMSSNFRWPVLLRILPSLLGAKNMPCLGVFM